MGWEDQTATPDRVLLLQGQSGFPLGAALDIALEPPGRGDWKRFLEAVFLALGVLLVAAGVIFFFAANWSYLGHFGKFFLVEFGIVLGFAGALRAGLGTETGGWALTLSSLLVGALLALYGQTYQLEADSWRLFAGWAALILPWTLAAAHPPLWLLTWALSNIALGLAIDGEHLIVGGVNLVLWILVDRLRRSELHWVLYAAAVTTLGSWTLVACGELAGNDFGPGVLLALAAAAGTLGYYRGSRRNGFLLAAACGTLISCATTLAAVNLLELDNALGFLLTAGLLIAEVSTAVWWLRRQL